MIAEIAVVLAPFGHAAARQQKKKKPRNRRHAEIAETPQSACLTPPAVTVTGALVSSDEPYPKLAGAAPRSDLEVVD